MDQLTPFERALLDQFRTLADEFDRSQLASEDMSKQLGRWSRAISERLGAIEKRQAQIEAFDGAAARCLDRAERANRELGDAGERVARRAEALSRARPSWSGSRLIPRDVAGIGDPITASEPAPVSIGALSRPQVYSGSCPALAGRSGSIPSRKG